MSDFLEKARFAVTQKVPYMSSLLYGIVPIETDQIPTAGISKNMVLYYNKQFMETLSVEEQAVILIHEISHIFLGHHDRRIAAGISNFLKWNLAGDAEINDDLLLLGLQIPSLKKILIISSLWKLPAGEIAEWYYSRIPESCQLSMGGSAGCGTGAGANPLPGEENEKDQGRNSEEVKRFKDETARSIKEHTSRNRGFVPSNWVRKANEICPDPKISWRDLLASNIRSSFAQQKGRQDYSYSRINSRRSSSIIFPSMISPILRLGIIIDTSGSMSENDLGMAVNCVRSIISQLEEGEYFLATVDAELHDLKQIFSAEEVCASLKGGGGSDLTQAFEALKDLKVPSIVTITDLEATIPESVYANVIWVKCGSSEIIPPYGTVVEVSS